jgi:Tfp pilus assembly protein PilF
MKRAERALREDKIFEARRLATEALALNPKDLRTQALMAKILDREIVREKTLSPDKLPEELTAQEKKLQIKTWLERSQGFLQVNEFDQALLASEQVFRLDPGNPDASRLIDEIKAKARAQGKEEGLFLQDLYQQEIETRIKRYGEEAKAWFEANRSGAARLAAEKVLILDPKNAEAQKLLALLDQREETAGASALRESPGGQ